MNVRLKVEAMRLSKIAMLVFAGTALASGHAGAATLTAVSTGVIGSGTDLDGTFGGGNLTGDAYTLSIVFDLSVGYASSYHGTNSVEGGAIAHFPFGEPSLGNAVLTINGDAYTFYGDHLSEASAFDNGTSSGISQYIEGYPNRREEMIGFGATAASGVFSNDLATPPSGDICLIASCSGSFFIDANSDGTYPNVSGTLDPTYSVTVTGGVPEPAAWGLMVLGFALVGAAARRPNPRPAATPA